MLKAGGSSHSRVCAGHGFNALQTCGGEAVHNAGCNCHAFNHNSFQVAGVSIEKDKVGCLCHVGSDEYAPGGWDKLGKNKGRRNLCENGYPRTNVDAGKSKWKYQVHCLVFQHCHA